MLILAFLFLIFDNMTLACWVRMVDRKFSRRSRNGGRSTYVLLFCLGTFSNKTVVGQQLMGQAAQVQVTLDGVSAQYLIIA